jgi:hypothetical protein
MKRRLENLSPCDEPDALRAQWPMLIEPIGESRLSTSRIRARLFVTAQV